MLCADKTGTLTEGRIRLRVVFDGETEFNVDQLTAGAAGAARIVSTGLRASPEGDREAEPLPHLTDRAVVAGAALASIDAAGHDDAWNQVAELAFEPGRAYHAVLGDNGRGRILSVKGAPEVVLPRCLTWARPDGDRQLDEDLRRGLVAGVDRLARRGFRVLAVAEREASDRRDLDDERVERLRLVGFLGLSDPIRPTAAESVTDLRSAGVDVVMLTGDHPSTAEGIAAELGILNGAIVLTGQEIDELDDDTLVERLDDVSVFARVTPAQKVRLVHTYQRAGRVVAMTGDGANDAPAISLADVGVALGENSTSAARAVADVIVPNGRIESVVDAIVEGRAMWASVRDALAILLGGNLGEIGFTLGGAALTGRSPLNARQLLLVNLFTDVLPAMTIAMRPPPDISPAVLLHEGPKSALSDALSRSIVLRAVTTAAGAGTAWTAARLTGRRRRANTIALAALVGTQLGQTATTSGRDPLVLAATAGSAALLVGIVQTPVVSQLFGCTPLGPVGWSIAAGSSAGATAASVIGPSLFERARGTLRPYASRSA